MNPSRVVWVFLMGIVCAVACAEAVAEVTVEIYENPKAVVSGGNLYVFVGTKGAPGNPCVCLREDDAGGWSRLGELRAEYSCVAESDGTFYLFLPLSVIELRADNCEKVGEVRWPYNWRPQSAEVIDGTLTAFGVDRNSRLYSASMQIGSGAAAPDAAAEAQPDRWHEQSVPVREQGSCAKVRTLLIGDQLWAFWTTKGADGSRQTLWAAALDEGAPSGATKIATLNGNIEFAPLASEGEPAVIYAILPDTLSGERGLSLRRHHKDRWLPAEPVHSVSNPFTEQTQALSAASLGGKTHLLLGTTYRILRATYDGQKWTPPEDVLSDPRVKRLMEHMPYLLGGIGGGLVVLLASLIRSRFLPRRAIIAGAEYTLAPWWQRGGAYAFDLLISSFAVQAIHAVAGRVPSEVSMLSAVLAFEMIYFSGFEARSGKTLGKRLFGLIVLSRNGGYPSFGEAALRNLPRALTDGMVLLWLAWLFPFGWIGPLGWLVGSVLVLNTRGSQRIGDLAAGTYVVKEHRKQ